MTNGYFVIEEKGKIKKVVYLMSDAYLDNGYGEKIIRAFAEKQELKLMERIYQNLDLMDKKNIRSIKPEWYRKTVHSDKGDIFSEYAYVVRGEKLRAYHYGKLLFCLKREDAEIWLYLLKNMQQLIDHFLYSGELLEYQWKNYFSMFQFLQKKIEEGFGKQEFQQYMRREGLPLAFFRDEHLVDVWNRYDRPAYQKIWKRGTQEVLFIVARQERIWRAYIQGPYSRIAVFQKCSSEKKMCDVIRLELRKEVVFLIYENSIEVNLLKMILAKEKINLFMKNQLIASGELYEKFGINPQIFSLLMTTGVDQEGKLQIQWGEQKIR